MTTNADEDGLAALRDAAQGAADALSAAGTASLAEIHEGIRAALDGVQPGALLDDETLVRMQFAALLRRFAALAEHHPDPVSVFELDLPADARFLRDMAAYLSRRYGLESGT